MRTIAGRYELVRLVGRGGMGEVWQAHDRTISRTVAVKLMPLDPDDRRGADALLREARTAGALHDPGVVTVHDVGVDAEDGSLFLVMAYLSGRDLASVLRQDGPCPVPVALDWTAQVADTLATAHAAGIVHRDLKPANLMLTDSGRIVVLDFGIARLAASLTRSSKVMGTLGYMAPERFDEQPGDARSDLYSLGCVLSELLVGELPFPVSGPIAMMRAHVEQAPEPPSRSRADVPAAVDELVLELLAKDPHRRPADARSVAGRLREIMRAPEGFRDRSTVPVRAAVPAQNTATTQTSVRLKDLEVAASPSSVATADTGRLSVSRRRLLWAGAATAVVGGGAVGAVAWAGHGSGTGSPPGAVPKWTFQAGSMIDRHPTVVDGVVYVGSSDGNLYAIDTVTGALKWNFRAADGILSSPVVAQGVVYVADVGGSVYATDIATRTTLWVVNIGAAVSSDVVVTDGALGVRSDDGATHLLDAKTGKSLWSVTLGSGGGSPARSTPVLANNIVYTIGADRRLYAVNQPSAGQMWAVGSNFVTDIVLDDYQLYVGDQDGTLHTINSLSGAELWSCRTPTTSFSSSRTSLSTPLIAGGMALLIADEPCAIDLRTGTVKWQFAANRLFQPSCAAVGGVFYACAGTTVYALDIATGTQKWKCDIAGGKAATVTVADANTLLVSDADGALFALTPPGSV
ncbi:serine/threonine-protein kinase [Catenulispora subtropica]|uniref:serine/threonine-protein kinase n=1 Tax=Catenulispora subtropica TaxID=450798 RepID=UPI0031DC62AE